MPVDPRIICQEVLQRGWASRERLGQALATFRKQEKMANFLLYLQHQGCISASQTRRLKEFLSPSSQMETRPPQSVAKSRRLPLLGGNFAKYQMMEELGEGGMGKVFLALDRDLKRKTAIKICTQKEEDYLLRFLREAQIGSRLEHPNVAPVYDVGRTSDGKVYLAMKYIEGIPLSEILEKLKRGEAEFQRDYPLRRRLAIFCKVLEGLGFAHDKNIIHRDLKPENIMVGQFGEVLIVDWGLAKSLSEEEGGLVGKSSRRVWESDEIAGGQTQVGSVMGTPGYLPPEQALGQLDRLSPRSDIYSLGVILYEILTFRNPFPGEDMNQVLLKAVDSEFLPPRQAAPSRNISPALEAIVLKAMSSEPDDRYQKTSQMLSDIQAFLDDDFPSVFTPPLHTRVKKVIQRHSALLIVLAVISLMIASFSYFLAREKERKLQAQRKKTQAMTEKELAMREKEKILKKSLEAEVEKRRLEKEARQAREEALERERAHNQKLRDRLKANAHIRVARAHMQQNFHFDHIKGTVVPALKKALEIYPGHTEARFELVRIYFYLEKKKKALGEVVKLFGDFFSRDEERKKRRKKFTQMFHKIYSAFLLPPSQRDSFDFPSNFEELKPAMMAMIHWKTIKALLLAELRQEKKALATVEEVLANPEGKTWENYVIKARVLLNLHRFNEALSIMNSLVATYPHIPFLYLTRGFIYRRMDRPNLALADCAKVKKMDPSCYVMWLSVGRCIARDQAWKKEKSFENYLYLGLTAWRFSQKALSLDSDYESARNSLERMERWFAQQIQVSGAETIYKPELLRYLWRKIKKYDSEKVRREFALFLHHLWKNKGDFPQLSRTFLRPYVLASRSFLTDYNKKDLQIINKEILQEARRDFASVK